ncbi:hypothetical protein ACFSFY_03170 [Sporosarcina siberiensis]|uniref:Uncharacterized protein n=1 Tax=Sporosarcina siberiensis TaxID=1365606 RepID=A0ABW4SDQ4_9BACL
MTTIQSNCVETHRAVYWVVAATTVVTLTLGVIITIICLHEDLEFNA